MKLTQEFKATLQEHINNGLIKGRKHPTLPLTIYKYTKEAQYACTFADSQKFNEATSKEWDDVLLSCRGLIVDDEDNIIVKPFSKFFNYEELQQSELDARQNMKYVIEDKVDGSLGILFNYNNEWHIATQGSFDSEQAVLGMNVLKNKYSNVKLNTNHVYLLEIISPLNRIVVFYPESDLVLLAVKDIDNNFTEIDTTIYNVGFTQVEQFNHLDLKSLKQLNLKDKEGFVVKYVDGFRYKVKFADYLRLHAVMTGLSAKHILQSMVEGEFLTKTLENTPDEFYTWLSNTESMFLMWYNEFYHEVLNSLNNVYSHMQIANYVVTKKEIAMFLNQNKSKHFSYIISNVLKSNPMSNVEQYVWELVEKRRKEKMKSDSQLQPQTFFNKE